VGEKIMATTDAVRRTGEWLLETHPWVLVERVVAQAHRIGELYQQLEQTQAELDRVQAENRQLEEQLAASQRAEKRQAAPFRVAEKKRKRRRKRPGRSGGHAGQWRQRPPDEAVDEHIEVPLETCPECGCGLPECDHQVIEQTLIDLPPVTPQVIRLRTYRQQCPECQRQVASTHPLQVSTATGAAGTHLGPRALGFAASLHHESGLSMRNCCRTLERLMGLRLTPGGLSQALRRMADRMEDQYDDLLSRLQGSTVLHLDETGWWVASEHYWLWVVTNERGTYYRVVPHRNRATAQSLLGEHFDGVLVSDCLNIYDGLDVTQQKCYAHHLKAISQALNTPAGSHSLYLLEVQGLLHLALVLKQFQSELSDTAIASVRQWLEQRADELLQSPRGDPNDAQRQHEEAIRRRLYHQRSRLFTFLDYEAVNATNNQAERQLRPAVIRRKVSAGNKTEAGARTWQILASLAATASQTGQSFIDQVATAMSLQKSDVKTER
jgi:hypothetical protein